MQNALTTNQNTALTVLAQRQIRVYWPEYHRGKFHNLLVFGPNYRAKDSRFWKEAKKEALEHVLEKSEFSSSELMNTMGSIEEEARAAYANDVLNDMTGLDFHVMMALDGCLFLLLAFSILGAGTNLKFREDHLVFGIGYAAEEMTRWLRSMFLVGNQIPFIVLEKLMELRFFQDLKATNQWTESPELGKRALYKFLIVGQEPNPVDLIHCLQSLMLGTTNGSVGPPKMLHDIEGISSAQQLSEQGIKFEKLDEELGSRRICYERSTFSAVLSLPVFWVDRHTDLMIECLTKYEIAHQYRGIEPEVSSYFKLLKELIRTPEDLEVLSSSRVIQGEPERLLRVLRAFDCTVTSDYHCQVKKQVNECSTLQWRKLIKLIVQLIVVLSSCLALLFAFLQTEYTILGYNKKGS